MPPPPETRPPGPFGPLAAAAWLDRWERQQAALVEGREARFAAMLDLLAPHLAAAARAGRSPARVLDLGCGPGSLAFRVARRFPGAEVAAVDADPVLLALGRAAVPARGGVVRFVDADLRDPGWRAALGGGGGFDAVVSTTALHWLDPADLVRVYGEAFALLRAPGLLLNGDYLVHARAPRLEALARAAADAALGAVRAADPGAEGWEAWWEALGREVPALGPLLEERARRYAGYGTDRDGHAGLHLGALLQAGFAEAEVLWRGRSSTIVAAFKA